MGKREDNRLIGQRIADEREAYLVHQVVSFTRERGACCVECNSTCVHSVDLLTSSSSSSCCSAATSGSKGELFRSDYGTFELHMCCSKPD